MQLFVGNVIKDIHSNQQSKQNITAKLNVFYCHVCKNKVDYRKATKTKNLSITHPQIANEWHPTKNNIGPDEVTYGVGKNIGGYVKMDMNG